MLRARTVVWHVDRSIFVVSADGVRSIGNDWPIERHEVSSDGRYVLALGDDSRRARVWEAATARLMLDLVGDPERRQSLRVGLSSSNGETLAWVASTRRKTELFSLAVHDASERAWVSTSGLLSFHVERIVELGSGWSAVQGFRHAEQYDTAVAVRTHAMLADPETLQTALRTRPKIGTWGYRVAVGPVTGGQVVFFRDPELDDEEPPNDPDEALTGLMIWDLEQARVVERIAYRRGDVLNGSVLGGNAAVVAVEVGGRIDVVTRRTGEVRQVEGLALDPYRLEVVCVRGESLKIVAIGSPLQPAQRSGDPRSNSSRAE